MADIDEYMHKDSMKYGKGNGGVVEHSPISVVEYGDTIVWSMHLLKRFEQVCDTTECGELIISRACFSMKYIRLYMFSSS